MITTPAIAPTAQQGTIPLQSDVAYYNHDGYYWRISPRRLVQYSKGFFMEWPPGSHAAIAWVHRLRKTAPIPDSEGEAMLRMVKEGIDL